MEWTDMMHYQQQMQKLMRSLLPVRKSILTVSECELLAHLYLQPEENTPILLGKSSGMKLHAALHACTTMNENQVQQTRQYGKI